MSIIEEEDIPFEDDDITGDDEGVWEDGTDIDLDENEVEELTDHGKGYKRGGGLKL